MAAYASILLVVGLAVALAVFILVSTHLVGPRRRGAIKNGPYESGMPLVTDARRRFNVRFYIVAMLFLLFDVEVVILWPWALAFHEAATGIPGGVVGGDLLGKGFLLAGAAVFLILLLVGFIYEWRKGVFQWN